MIHDKAIADAGGYDHEMGEDGMAFDALALSLWREGRALRAEAEHLRQHRDELQRRGTYLVEENRALRAALAHQPAAEVTDAGVAALRELQRTFHARAREHGWYDDAPVVTVDRIAARIALIHSEASEALEAVRDGLADNTAEWSTGAKPVGVASELADVIIRVGDLAEWMGIDLGAAVSAKHRFNGTRPMRHGGKRL